MTIELKGQEYRYPTELKDITLRQRIDFYHTYGKELDQQLKAIAEAGGDEHEYLLYQADSAIKHVAFYTGIDIEELRSEVSFLSVHSIYLTGAQMMQEEEKGMVLQPSYDYAGEKWVIAPPAVTPDSEITFNEFLTSFEIIRQMQALGNGKWDALPYLCCIYLRKEGEPFNESLVKGERMDLMMDLPMDIALAVAFFLSSCLHTYASTLASSSQPEAGEALVQPATSSAGDGFPSSAT